MNHFRTERRAIYDTGKFFTECGWIFREQPIIDLGIDALVETPLDERGKVNFFALQIKGGESNFRRKKDRLTFYFYDRHYLYWNAISENYPLLIVLQDPQSQKTYWQHYAAPFISKTTKHWKIDISYANVLSKDAKDQIMDILTEFKQKGRRSIPLPKPKAKLEYSLNISFVMDYVTLKSLYLTIRYKNEIFLFDLKYKPKKNEWDVEQNFLSWDNAYHYSILDFKRYIHSQFEKTSKSKQSYRKLIDNISVISEGGIESVQEFIFDDDNKGKDIPMYKDFIKAFELYSNLKTRQYEVQALGLVIHFKTAKGTFEMSTYASLKEHLRNCIDERHYDEIFISTSESIWGEVYIDAGIEKFKFIPVMQQEWESYWRALYKRVKEKMGRTAHLDESKQESWRMFKTFSDLYTDSGNAIDLAHDFDEMVMYPIAVITMLRIFNAEVCYGEYCEHEFFGNNSDWESISLDDDNIHSPVFFVKPCDL